MSIAIQTFRGASWLAMFKLVSQSFSWVVTIMIARILAPDDYGLYAMAILITGYAEVFSTMGLGSAIVQKPNTNKDELSSVFWFSFAVGCLLALSCYPISYISAYTFKTSKIIPLTQSVSIIFLCSGMLIVPQALLSKQLEFKKLGRIELTCTIISTTLMLLIAYLGGGAWALIGGRIFRALIALMLTYSFLKWLPRFHFNFNEAKSYLKFGITVSIGYSLFYISDMSDKFFAGRAWNATMLGYYTFALQLAQVPTEKIVVLINQVSFAAFSRIQHDKEQFSKLYLDIIKVTATLVLPLFVGGYLVGEDFVKVLLNEKWFPMILLFKYLCLSQIITSLNAVNNHVQNARGRPHWGLYFNLTSVLLVPVSFYFAVQYGLQAILIPWFTTYLFICIIWITITLKSLDINIHSYFERLSKPIIGTLLMSIAVLILNKYLAIYFPGQHKNLLLLLLFVKIIMGGIVYVSYLWIFDKSLFYNLQKLRKS
jgi:O-antigen/teichoic acid export membrane protein